MDVISKYFKAIAAEVVSRSDLKIDRDDETCIDFSNSYDVVVRLLYYGFYDGFSMRVGRSCKAEDLMWANYYLRINESMSAKEAADQFLYYYKYYLSSHG